MIEQTIWNIYRDNGEYIGQYEAFAAQVALHLYFELQGKAVSAGDFKSELLGDDSLRISYQSEAYIVNPQIH